MKNCPYCAEEIRDKAVKCKHCMEFLDESMRAGAMAQYASGDLLPWYCKTSFIIITFVTVPPFALPSVWLHPRMPLIWKLVITIIILLTCWMMYKAFVAFVHRFEEATRMMEGMRF